MSSVEHERRDRLFRRSKPHIRPFEWDDIWVMWAGYDLGAFQILPRGLSKDEFAKRFGMILAGFHNAHVIEDDCKWFKSHRGPVCIVGVHTDGWKIEPHAEFFRWASARNVIRSWVIFMQKARWSKDIGACVVRVSDEYQRLARHMQKYGVLYYVGKIPNGFPTGDEYTFQIRGKRQPLAELTEVDQCLSKHSADLLAQA